jgi:hypothetical protein
LCPATLRKKALARNALSVTHSVVHTVIAVIASNIIAPSTIAALRRNRSAKNPMSTTTSIYPSGSIFFTTIDETIVKRIRYERAPSVE